MRSRSLFLWVAIGLFLGGCSLAPTYTQPGAPVPDTWPRGAAYERVKALPGATKVSELTWEAFFADEQLREIIETALEKNRDLRIAALNVERAQALYGVQRAELFPVVNAKGAGSKQRLSSDMIGPGDSRTIEQYSIDLGIAAWEIDFFGRVRNLKDQALEVYLATDEARRSAQIALVFEVARLYLSLAADRENLNLAGSILEARQAAYDIIGRQYDVGLANELDLRRAQTQVDVARGDMVRYRQSVAQDQNALTLLAGTPVPEDLLPADLGSVVPPKEISQGLPSEALLNRPDIIAAEHRLKGAYAFIGAARAAFFPRIALTTAVGTASDELSGLFGSGTNTWNFSPQIVMPIFDARTWAAYRTTKADQKIALAQYEKTIQTAFREVADVLAVQGTVDQQLSAQQSLVTALEETHRLSTKRYENGIDSYLSVLDAQRSLYAAQQGLISLRLAKRVNQVRLYAVLGGGGAGARNHSGGS